MKKRLLTALAIILMVTSVPAIGLGAQAIDQIEEGELTLYTISEPYQYPIIQGSDEWFELTTPQERVSAFYVPDEIVSSMTTEALMLTVMSNPYFINLYAFSSMDIGLEVVSGYVSGLEELCSRPDFYSAFQGITQQQFDANCAAICDDNETRYNIEIKLLGAIYNEISGSAADNILPAAEPGTIETPNKTPIGVKINQTYTDLHMTMAEVTATMNSMLANHPSATIVVNISEATAAYNCHSYAWHSKKLNNNVWMDDPSAYMTDGSYTQTIAANADIVYWKTSVVGGSPVHSAVVAVPGSGSNEAVVISKWECYGVIRHNQSDCPYSAQSTAITYWYR